MVDVGGAEDCYGGRWRRRWRRRHYGEVGWKEVDRRKEGEGRECDRE